MLSNTCGWPQVESLFLTSLKETVGKAQWQNALRETVAVAKPWPFDIADISVPVGIWQVCGQYNSIADQTDLSLFEISLRLEIRLEA